MKLPIKVKDIVMSAEDYEDICKKIEDLERMNNKFGKVFEMMHAQNIRVKNFNNVNEVSGIRVITSMNGIEIELYE